MITLTLSPKFQLVIPKHIREALKLKVSTHMQVLQYGDHIEFIPVRPMQAIRSMLKGMNTDFGREDDQPNPDRRFRRSAVLPAPTLPPH